MPVSMKVLKPFAGRKEGELFTANNADVKALEALKFACRTEEKTETRERRRYRRRDMTAE